MSRCIDAENIWLTDVPSKLRKVREAANDIPNELYDFTDYLASIADSQVNPAGMITLLICGLTDIDSAKSSSMKEVIFPEKLLTERYQIFAYISSFPLIIDKIASKEFAKEFRELFDDMMLCKLDLPVYGEKRVVI